MAYCYFEWRKLEGWLAKLDFVWTITDDEKKYLQELDRIARS